MIYIAKNIYHSLHSFLYIYKTFASSSSTVLLSELHSGLIPYFYYINAYCAQYHKDVREYYKLKYFCAIRL